MASPRECSFFTSSAVFRMLRMPGLVRELRCTAVVDMPCLPASHAALLCATPLCERSSLVLIGAPNTAHLTAFCVVQNPHVQRAQRHGDGH